MKNLLFLFFISCSLELFCQPQSINYQAIARDSTGHPISNQSITLKLSILDGSPTGTNLYSEIHAIQTGATGLFNVAIGTGTIISGNFSAINWGGANKWLKTEMDAGNGSGFILIGTSQFLSVPYALYSQHSSDIKIRVSATGDTLYLTDTQYVIIPNLSRSSATSVSDVDNNKYQLVNIGNQTWLKTNLRTAHYRDGSAILTGLSNSSWSTTSTGAYSSNGNDSLYGKLYNWYAMTDARGLCPIGYHVATTSDFGTLISYLGGSSFAGGKMKETGLAHWQSPNTSATNSSGFTALPAGSRINNGTYFSFGSYAYFWAVDSNTPPGFTIYQVDYNTGAISSYQTVDKAGVSIRCVND
jgi:uncharacterized protein (TIGR02145 family)